MKTEIVLFIEQRKAQGSSSATLAAYEYRLTRLGRHLRKLDCNRWQDVKVEDVENFVTLALDQGLLAGSLRSILSTAREFYTWLAEQGKTITNPLAALPAYRQWEDPLPQPPLSEADVCLILQAMPKNNVLDLRNVVVIELLYSAGLRLSEALAVNVADCDLDSRVLRVHSAKRGTPRDLPMLRGLSSALADYLALRRTILTGPDHGALLLASTGKRLSRSSIHRLIRKLNRARILPQRVHAHLFRHSIAVHLLRGGADIRYIQQFLGHALLETTKIYLRLVPADIEKVYHAAMPAFAIAI